MASELSLTDRQRTLFSRIEALIDRAGDFPLPIVEIWGGGSLFRLDPSPNDADCVFRFDGEHSLWQAFFETTRQPDEDGSAWAALLSQFSQDDVKTLEWWRASLSESDFSTTGLLPAVQFICYRVTKRLITREFPRISVVELTPRPIDQSWRMSVALIWSTVEPYSLERIYKNAEELRNADRRKMLVQLAEIQHGIRLLREAIVTPDREKVLLACAYVDGGLDDIPPVRPSRCRKPTSEIRKMLKEKARTFEALKHVALVGSSDPTMIAIEVFTSKKKIRDWGETLIKEEVITRAHIALAKHVLKSRSRKVRMRDFRLITDLHDRGCLIQAEHGRFWFFASHVRGVVLWDERRAGYSAYSRSVLLTHLDDERPFVEWPICILDIPEIDELWPMVEAVSRGEPVPNSTPPLALTCPYCETNVILSERGSNQYRCGDCSHLLALHLRRGPEQALVDHHGIGPIYGEYESIDAKHVKGKITTVGDWTASGLFVEDPEEIKCDLECFSPEDRVETDVSYARAYEEFLRSLINSI